MAKIKTKTRKKQKAIEKSLPFTRSNYVFFAAGILLIIIGYIALAQGPYDSFYSLSIAPVLLVIGYCVIIPFAILYRGDRTKSEQTVTK